LNDLIIFFRGLGVEIIAGAHNITRMEETQKYYRSTHFIVHEDWDTSGLENNIALIKLSNKDIKFTRE